MDNQKRKLTLPGISFYPDNLTSDETVKRFCAATTKPADDSPKTVKLSERQLEIANEIFGYIRMPVDCSETLAALGMRRTKGVLLFGTPGTGKTSIAKAVENECNRTVDRISFFPTEISELLTGNTSAKIKELFHCAKTFAPSVVFLDEVDALFHDRGPASPSVLTLLTQIDGINSSETEGVFLLAATNRKDVVEGALLRPGRIEESIELERPDAEERMKLLKSLTATWNVKNVDFNPVVAATDDFTAADMEFLCKKAGMRALKRSNTSLLGPPENWVIPLANKVTSRQSDFNYALALVYPTSY